MWKGDIPSFSLALNKIRRVFRGIFGNLDEDTIIPIIKISEEKAWIRKYFTADSGSFDARIISLVKAIKLISKPIHTINQCVAEILKTVPVRAEMKNKGRAKGGIIKVEGN